MCDVKKTVMHLPLKGGLRFCIYRNCGYRKRRSGDAATDARQPLSASSSTSSCAAQVSVSITPRFCCEFCMPQSAAANFAVCVEHTCIFACDRLNVSLSMPLPDDGVRVRKATIVIYLRVRKRRICIYTLLRTRIAGKSTPSHAHTQDTGRIRSSIVHVDVFCL